MKEKGDVLMPQLNKGGKFVFGLSLIHDDLTVQFPTQALEEYQVLNDDKIIIFTGSKVTGGFCVTTYPLLSKSKLSHILHECPQLEKQSIPRGTLVGVAFIGKWFAFSAINITWYSCVYILIMIAIHCYFYHISKRQADEINNFLKLRNKR